MKNNISNLTTKNTHLGNGMSKKCNEPIHQYKERFNKIIQPNSIEEFRQNLLKYYFSNRNEIYTQEIGYVNVNQLSCIQDLVIKVQSRGYSTLNLTPKVVELEKWKKYVTKNQRETHIDNTVEFFEEFWMKEDSHIIIPDNLEYMRVCQKIMGNLYWKDLTQLRELYQFFHHKVMGKYGLVPNFQSSKETIFSLFKY